MANKINLQQLAKTLAQKKGISQRDAETFLREFFDGIVQNVTTDKLVKVKGLGTFKLIEVQDRESVNVSTGERFIIPGHSKLSFTPETALKDLVNKPFADFQSVVLNEGTSIEEMERLPEGVSDEEAEASEQEAEAQAEAIQESPAALMSEAETNVEPEPAAELEPTPTPEPKPEPLAPSEPLAKEKPASSTSSSDEKKGRHWLWILGLLLLCLLGFVAYKFLEKPSAKVEEPVQPPVEAPVEEAPAPEVQYAQVPDGEYKIVGTKKTYVMKPGDYISRIAIQEYGDKEFAKYIIVHNDFPDPDNVPVDMEIKLPELQKIE